MTAILNTSTIHFSTQNDLKTHLMVDKFLSKILLSRVLFILVISGGFSTYSFAQVAGTLDNSFGINGKIITPIDTISDEGNSMVIQSDHKIILGGTTKNSFTSFDFALIRYNNDGTLDNTFGTGGKVITPIEEQSEGYSVAIQSDGKIILAGNTKNGTNIFNFALARYNNNGTLDATFGTGGKSITSFGISYSSGESLGIDSNNKIILGGYAYNGSSVEIALARYNNNVSVGIRKVKQIETKIYPNPFNSSTTIQFSTPLHKAELNIYTTHGQLVKHLENISGQEIQLFRNNLPSGEYFFQLTENNKIIVVDKLTISDE
jgi:uncharacterized delta-60 repeat protein